MSDSSGMMKKVVLAVLGLGIVIVGWRMLSPATFGPEEDRSLVIPRLSAAAQRGEKVFNDNCLACHGKNAAGTGKGPPLIHDYYNPGHHADGAFYLAVARGVRPHHWNFGPMPPQPQVSEDQVRVIIQYVRELQVANGITYKRH